MPPFLIQSLYYKNIELSIFSDFLPLLNHEILFLKVVILYAIGLQKSFITKI